MGALAVLDAKHVLLTSRALHPEGGVAVVGPFVGSYPAWISSGADVDSKWISNKRSRNESQLAPVPAFE